MTGDPVQISQGVIAWLPWYDRDQLRSTPACVRPMQFEQNWFAVQPKQDNL
jgi:hypothetical protein